MSSEWREPEALKSAKPATYENVRAAILVSLDFANLDMDFPRIVHWLKAAARGRPRPSPGRTGSDRRD
jgi:hypothetical protein